MTYTDEVLADAPLTYYRLAEQSGATTMLDASSNARDGVYSGSLMFQQTGLLVGDTDPCVRFIGSGYGYTPNAAWMSTPAWTLEAVVKKMDDSWAVVAASDAFELTITDTGTLLATIHTSAGTTSLQGGSGLGVGSVGATTHHVAATYDGATLSLYVDGTSVGSKGYVATPNAVTSDLFVGIAANGTDYPFGGFLDEVAFYETALSESRLSAHAAVARGETPTPPGTPTDTSNRTDGLALNGSSQDLTVYPVEGVPSGLRVEPLRVMAQTTPDPTLVKGRPV